MRTATYWNETGYPECSSPVTDAQVARLEAAGWLEYREADLWSDGNITPYECVTLSEGITPRAAETAAAWGGEEKAGEGLLRWLGVPQSQPTDGGLAHLKAMFPSWTWVRDEKEFIARLSKPGDAVVIAAPAREGWVHMAHVPTHEVGVYAIDALLAVATA